MTTIVIERSGVIDAPPELVWSVVADLDAYADHAPSLRSTEVVSGEGVGARRRCVDRRGAAWEETCAVWVPHRRYVVEVEVSTYPLRLRILLRRFTGTWTLSTAEGATRVSIRFEGTLRRLPGVARLGDALARRGALQADRILQSYATAVDALRV